MNEQQQLEQEMNHIDTTFSGEIITEIIELQKRHEIYYQQMIQQTGLINDIVEQKLDLYKNIMRVMIIGVDLIIITKHELFSIVYGDDHEIMKLLIEQ